MTALYSAQQSSSTMPSVDCLYSRMIESRSYAPTANLCSPVSIPDHLKSSPNGIRAWAPSEGSAATVREPGSKYLEHVSLAFSIFLGRIEYPAGFRCVDMF